MRLIVVLPFHSLFHAPHFVAEGLEVTTRVAADATGTTRALVDGAAHVSLGGLVRTLDVADRGGRILPHFAEVNRRNGSFLLSRHCRPDFQWRDVVGRTVISFAGAPTPCYCLLAVLRRHGLDPTRVRFIRDLRGADAVKAPRDGEVVERFTRAVYRAQRWTGRHDARAIDGVLGHAFPDVPGFEYLQGILLDGGFLRRRHRDIDLVDTAVARRVVEAERAQTR